MYLLKTHRESHNERKFACTQCSKSYTSISYLKGHIRAVHDQALCNVCDICARVFRTKTACKSHKNSVHSNKNIKPAQCNECGLWLKHNTSLMTHIKRHHKNEGKKFICDICGKVKPNYSTLYNHKKAVHFTEEKYKCTVCPKAYKYLKSLKEHIASHTGDRLYSCKYCSKTCNSSATMHAHRKKTHPVEWEKERAKKSWIVVARDEKNKPKS